MLFGLMCVSLAIHAQVDTLIRLTPDQRVIALWKDVKHWKTTWELSIDSVSTLRRIDSVRVLARQLGDERLYWYACLQRIQCRAVAQDNLDKPVTAYRAAESAMEQCPEAVVRASYYFVYGEHLMFQDDIERAVKLLLRARRLFEQIGYEHIPEGNQYLSSFGSNYYALGDYRKAITYVEAAERYPDNGLLNAYADWNTVGMAYLQLRQYGQAVKAFQRVIVLAKARHNSDYVGLGNGNLGNALRLAGNNREALPYLYTEVAMNEKTVPTSAAMAALGVAHALLVLDSIPKAKAYIDRASRLIEPGAKRPTFYFETLTLYYRKIGNFAKASGYMDSTMARKDSSRALLNNKILSVAESNVKAEQYLSKLQQVETETKWDILVRNIVIVALVLIAVAIVYSISQKQKLQQQQRKQAEAELTHAQTQLTQYLANLDEKNDLIEQITRELVTVRQESTEPDSNRNAQISALVNSVILTDKDWMHFRQLFEQAYPPFFTMLQQVDPPLTPAEFRLLALLKLAIPTKQMAYMLGVSVDSIHKSRYRLRKKIDANPTNQDLLSLLKLV